MNRPLNKEQVKGLFEQEAVLMGTENCVPDFRAAALFGGDTVLETTRWTPLPCEASKPPPVSTMFNC